MSIVTKVTSYKGVDVYMNNNDVERLGFNKNMTYEEMLSLAIKHKCPIIIKNGNGKWYLKGQGIDFTTVKEKVLSKINNNLPRYENITLYLVEQCQ